MECVLCSDGAESKMWARYDPGDRRAGHVTVIKEDVMFIPGLAVTLSSPLTTRVIFPGEKHREGRGGNSLICRGFCLNVLNEV